MHKIKINRAFLILLLFVVIAYFLSIVVINVTGSIYVDYDMYSDAILAKYIAQSKTLFPNGWHFGNQIYTVATPVLASLIYWIVGNAYLSLAIASCLMTALCLASFIWCVKPFAKFQSILIALLVLIGGTNVGLTAHADMEGLQLFYTMASYYACYIIGIFLTLGVYCRNLQGKHVNKVILCCVVLLNFALGIQSLREMLVLNLPLFILSLLEVIVGRNSSNETAHSHRKGLIIAATALVANLVGIVLYKLLVTNGIILQADIIPSASPQLSTNIKTTLRAFFAYIGLVVPNSAFSAFQCLSGVFSILVVATTIVLVVIDYIKGKRTILGSCILFFLISILGVFASGILIITLRSVYFFCWHLMVACCVLYLFELPVKRHQKLSEWSKNLVVICLLSISFLNYVFSFAISFRGLSETTLFYQQIVDQLNADGIEYIYSEYQSEQAMISALSGDKIVYASLYFSDDPEDLWTDPNFLYSDHWFEPEKFHNAYILLTDHSLQFLEKQFSTEYAECFLSNLELVYEFPGPKTTVYFYRGSEKMFNDIAN